MPANIYDLMPVLMCGMSWILCTLVSPNSWDHSDGLASARKLHVVTCNFFRDLWFLVYCNLACDFLGPVFSGLGEGFR